MMLRTFTCTLILALAGVTATARDIYVDNIAGDDRFTGTAPVSSNVGGGPLRTIACALHLARGGDRIVLADTGEPYRECITLHGARNSGSAARPFVIVGNGAILDGSRPVNPEAWEQYQGDIYRFRPKRTSHQQLFLNDRPLVRVPVDNNNLALPKLQPLQWCMLDRHIYLNLKRPSPDVPAEGESVPAEILERAQTQGWRYLPQQYDLTYAGHPVGVTLYDVRNVVIADLTVQGYQLDGINAHDKAFNTWLIGVNCRGNGRSGLSVGGASRVIVSESLLGNNGASQLRSEGFCVTEVLATEILAHTAPSVVRDGGDVWIDGFQLDSKVFNQHVDPPAIAPPIPVD